MAKQKEKTARVRKPKPEPEVNMEAEEALSQEFDKKNYVLMTSEPEREQDVNPEDQDEPIEPIRHESIPHNEYELIGNEKRLIRRVLITVDDATILNEAKTSKIYVQE